MPQRRVGIVRVALGTCMRSTFQAVAAPGSEGMTPWVSVRLWLPVILSTAAGAVDVTGFLALGGLFTAHLTGNLVIVAAHYTTGAFSQVGPLLAVPVYMAA